MNKIVLTVVIAVTVLLLLAWAGYNRWEETEQKQGLLDYFLASASSEPVPLCVTDEETRERLRVIMIDAIDEALKEQIKHLFEIWMKDERGQPDRARVGARAAMKAHQGARKAALEWTPPLCSG